MHLSLRSGRIAGGIRLASRPGKWTNRFTVCPGRDPTMPGPTDSGRVKESGSNRIGLNTVVLGLPNTRSEAHFEP